MSLIKRAIPLIIGIVIGYLFGTGKSKDIISSIKGMISGNGGGDSE